MSAAEVMQMDMEQPVKDGSMQNVFEEIISADPGDLEPGTDLAQFMAPSPQHNTHDQSVRKEAFEAAMTDVAAIVSSASSKRQKRTRQSFRTSSSNVAEGSMDSANRPPGAISSGPPSVYVIIHASTYEQVAQNVKICVDAGCAGVFLVNYDFDYPQMLPILRHIKGRFPNFFVGVNFQTMSGSDAFPILGKLAREGVKIDAYWAENAFIDEALDGFQDVAEQIQSVRDSSAWDGLYFGGIACANPKGLPKLCKPVAQENVHKAASIAVKYMDVICTTGSDLSTAPKLEKVSAMREGCGDTPLAACTGLTHENVHLYVKDVDCLLVSTSVMSDAYNVDGDLLSKLMDAVRAAA